MKNRFFKKALGLICAAILMLTAASALAQTAAPQQALVTEWLGGRTFSASVKTFDEASQTFPVAIYERDIYTAEEISALQVGDTLVFEDAAHTIVSIGSSESGITEMQFADGNDILLDVQQDGTIQAHHAVNDMACMHTVGTWNLKAAQNITLTDYSDLERDDPVTLTGLEAILAFQAQREKESIGLDCTVTSITLNERAEIAEIIIFYAPWQ